MLRRASGSLVVLAACSFSARVGSGGDDAVPQTFTDDALEGTARDGVIVAGRLEPDGFVLGGLHARGFQTALVDAGEDLAKVLADAATATETGAAYAQVPVDWVTARPRGLGLTLSDAFSIVYDGEILLPAGGVVLELDVDDRGIVEVLGQELAGDFQGPVKLALDVPEAGWYPIRAALTETAANARFVLAIVQGQVRTPVDANRLRARVTDHPGVLVYAFDGQGFVGERGHAARPTIDEAFGTLAPRYDLTTSIDRFSLRFAGQLRIDTAGTYTFGGEVGGDATDGFRIWIDGKPIAHHWLGHPEVPAGSVDLATGWHTLLVDYADDLGNAQVRVTMTGPDAPGGGAIDPERLRPVVVFGNTYTFATTTPTTIADTTSTFVSLPLPGAAAELIDAVDYGFRIDNQNMTALAITLFDCTAGQQLTVNPTPSYHYFPADTTCAGEVVNPPLDWQLRLNDSVAGNAPFIGSGSIRDYGLTALYHGGPKLPFAPVFGVTSAPITLAGARRITAARALGSLDGATVEIAIRTAETADALAAATYVVIREGVELEPAGELVQYRVTLTTDGWIAPILDRVEIDYVVAP